MSKTNTEVVLSDAQTDIFESFAEAFSAIGETSSSVVRALKDNKISGIEAFSILTTTPNLLVTIRSSLRYIRDWNYLDDLQQSEIVAAFAVTFELENSDAEKAIEKIVETAMKLSRAIDGMVKALKSFAVSVKK